MSFGGVSVVAGEVLQAVEVALQTDSHPVADELSLAAGLTLWENGPARLACKGDWEPPERLRFELRGGSIANIGSSENELRCDSGVKADELGMGIVPGVMPG